MSLRRRVTAGLGWTGGVRWLGLLLATATTAALARLLAPADFAVVVAAGAVANVVGILQESGLAAAVVQHRGDVDRASSTALVLNLAAATAGVAACVAASPWLAAFFGITEPAALAVAFAPLWLRAWTNVPVARLQRALAFGRCAVVDAVQLLAYPAATIPLAAAGAGPWALVLGQAVAALLGVVAAWALVRWRPRVGDFDWETARGLVRYGRPLVASSLLGVVNDRVDTWVVGRLFGPAALGAYAMAFRLATLPRTGFSFVVSRVLFPALAGLQTEPARFRAAYLRGLHWVAVLAAPSCAGLVLFAPALVAVVLGPRWAATVAPLRVLAVFGFLASLAATTGDVFKAAGHSTLIFRIGLVHSAVLWGGLAVLARQGLAAAAGAVLLATACSAAVSFVALVRVLAIPPSALWQAVRAPMLATGAMGAAVVAAAALPLGGGVVALLVAIALGAAVYVAGLAWLAPADAEEIGALVAALRRPRPLPPAAAVPAGRGR